MTPPRRNNAMMERRHDPFLDCRPRVSSSLLAEVRAHDGAAVWVELPLESLEGREGRPVDAVGEAVRWMVESVDRRRDAKPDGSE